MKKLIAAGIVAVSVACVAGLPAAASDRHEGYYYPKITSTESYVARADTLPESDRARRIGFITGISQQLSRNPYPAPYAIFAKGTEAEKLLIVATQSGFYSTLYRARALMATMTALARTTPLFRDLNVEDRYTFYDLCKMLGFKQLTISDGETYAHQVKFE